MFYLHVWLQRYWLVWVWHHGDEHVEEHDHVAAAVGPEHQQRPEPREVLHTRQLEVLEADEAEHRPEEGLQRLEEVGEAAPDEAGRVLVLLAPDLVQVALLFLQLRVVPQQLVHACASKIFFTH